MRKRYLPCCVEQDTAGKAIVFFRIFGTYRAKCLVCKYDYNNAAKRNPDIEVSLSELENCISIGNTTEQQYDCQRTAKHISDFLKKLPVTKRVIFIRRYWYCDSILQISEKYGFSESKVKSMLMRTRNELKKYLERQGVRV